MLKEVYVGGEIAPCGACGRYVWKSEGCPHMRRFTNVQPRNGRIKYAYTPDMDATARRLFRQREQAKAKRAKKKASLTSGQ